MRVRVRVWVRVRIRVRVRVGVGVMDEDLVVVKHVVLVLHVKPLAPVLVEVLLEPRVGAW